MAEYKVQGDAKFGDGKRKYGITIPIGFLKGISYQGTSIVLRRLPMNFSQITRKKWIG